MITVGSLFSGIGGLELGLERAGMEVRWQVENDDYASRVLAKHWPDVARYADVRDVGAHNLEPVDLICGGFPCQDVSLAGQRAGLEGQRSTLWSEFARCIRELRPRWVLAENVPGLLSSDSGRFFGAILRDLAAAGYDAEWQSIPAAWVGAPHLRWRVLLVASPDDCRKPVLSINGKQWGWLQARHQREGWLLREPAMGRMDARIPYRMDRLRCLGNAVVPQVAEWVGRMIVEAQHER